MPAKNKCCKRGPESATFAPRYRFLRYIQAAFAAFLLSGVHEMTDKSLRFVDALRVSCICVLVALLMFSSAPCCYAMSLADGNVGSDGCN